MSSVHASIHAQTAAKRSLEETVHSTNEYLVENTPANRFVTMFIAELDPATGTLKYINAGHNPPIVARANGTVEQLDSGGLPLGLMGFAEYEAATVSLAQGDAIIVYSDGVSEANNLNEDEFGMDRLKEVIRTNISRPASGIRDKIESALSDFTGTAPANDDITLVIVKRAAGAAAGGQ